jgi:dTDP-4-amino-4,6-dideoxygalactose transaminase
VHLHPYYRRRCGLEPDALPVTAAMSDRTLSLPLGSALGEGDVERVAAALTRALTAG